MIVELWPALFSCLFIATRHVKLDLIAGLEELRVSLPITCDTCRQIGLPCVMNIYGAIRFASAKLSFRVKICIGSIK